MAAMRLPFPALDRWQEVARKDDSQTAALIGISASKFSRFRNGLQELPIEDQIKLEAVTGVTPMECHEFHLRCHEARIESRREAPRRRRAPKKSPRLEGAA